MMRVPAVTTSMADAGASPLETPAVAEPEQQRDTAPLADPQSSPEQQREHERTSEFAMQDASPTECWEEHRVPLPQE